LIRFISRANSSTCTNKTSSWGAFFIDLIARQLTNLQYKDIDHDLD